MTKYIVVVRLERKVPNSLGGQDTWLSPTRPGFESRLGNYLLLVITATGSYSIQLRMTGVGVPRTAQEKSAVVLYADFRYRTHVWSQRRTTTTRRVMSNDVRKRITNAWVSPNVAQVSPPINASAARTGVHHNGPKK